MGTLRLLPLLAFLATANLQAARELPKYKRVGVVSLIGSEMSAKFVGVIAFANKGWDADTGRLAISDFVRDETVRALRENGVQAQALKVNARAWNARIRHVNIFSFQGLIGAYGADITTSKFRKELADLAQSNRLDAIIMFVPGRDTLNHSGEAWVGVGDTGFGFMTHGKQAIDRPYILGFLYLNDGATQKTIKRIGVEAFGDPVALSYHDRSQRYSETEVRQLEQSAMRAFARAVREALQKL